jgi:hypothetical protein
MNVLDQHELDFFFHVVNQFCLSQKYLIMCCPYSLNFSDK